MSGVNSAECQVCHANVLLTPKRRAFVKHVDASTGDPCSGSGTLPAANKSPSWWRLPGFIPDVLLHYRRYPAVGIAILLVFTVGTGVITYYEFLHSGAAAGDRSRVAPAVDPNLYLNFDGPYTSRRQECEGLLGFCLGQSITTAQDVFGEEMAGFPAPFDIQAFGRPYGETPPGLCHQWEYSGLESISICERESAIESIRLDFPTASRFALSMPEGFLLRAPVDLASETPIINSALKSVPFASSFLDGEGDTVVSFSWYLPMKSEGLPSTVLELIGRTGDIWVDEKPELCEQDPQGNTRYRYAEVLSATQEAPARIDSLEIRSVQARDDLNPQYC